MKSAWAVSQAMNRNPVDMNCNGVFGVAAAMSRIRSHGSSFLKRTATPMWVEVVEINGFETDAIHHRRNRQGVGGVHAQGRPQRLVAVAQRGLDQLQGAHERRSSNRWTNPVSKPPA